MKSIIKTAVLSVILISLVSCASLGNSYFAGTVGGVYLTSDDYSSQTSEINNSYNSLKGATWMFFSANKKLRPSECGNKVLFYSNIGESDFYNEYVPVNYRASSLQEAGFIILAEETEGPFFRDYTFQSGKKCKVYKGAAVLKLYSIKTGELLFTSEKVSGPEPPATFSVYGNPESVTYDPPTEKDCAAKIKSICSKISGGLITGSVPDERAMELAGVEIKKPKAVKNVSLTGTWTAKSEDEKFVYKFTDTGIAIYEYYVEDTLSFVDVLPFSYNGESIELDGTSYDYHISGKDLSIDLYSDDVVFKQTSKKVKVTNDKNKIYGVWTQKNYYSSLTLGISKNNFSIFFGTYRGMSDITADNESISFVDYNESDCRYWIIDDCLYIEDYGYFGEYGILKFTRKTSGGKDLTSLSVLTSREWDYIINQEDIDYLTPEEISGNSFTFAANGTFKDIPFHGSKREAQVKGTYTFDNHVIELSDGRYLTFAFIDNVAIGYSF